MNYLMKENVLDLAGVDFGGKHVWSMSRLEFELFSQSLQKVQRPDHPNQEGS